MARSKVVLGLIENPTNRKACYKKRRAGLLKKVKEISILCGVKACLVVYCPIVDERPLVWPSVGRVKELLLRFNDMPEMERRRRMVTQASFMREQVQKLQEKVLKIRKMNNQKEMDVLMHQLYDEGKSLSDFDASELMRLAHYVEDKMKAARKRIEHFEHPDAPDKISPPLPLLEAAAAEEEEGPFPPPEREVTVTEVLNDMIPCRVKLDDGQFKQLSEQQLFHPGQSLLRARQSNIGGNGSDARRDMVLQRPPNPYLCGKIDMVMPQDFGVSNGGCDLGFFCGSWSHGIGGSDRGLPYRSLGGTFGGRDTRLPYRLGSNLSGINMGIGLPYRNHGHPTFNIAENDMGLGLSLNNFGGTNGGMNMGRYCFNFPGSSSGFNMGVGPLELPGTSSTSSEENDYEMPAGYFGGNSGKSDWGNA